MYTFISKVLPTTTHNRRHLLTMYPYHPLATHMLVIGYDHRLESSIRIRCHNHTLIQHLKYTNTRPSNFEGEY